MENGTHGRFSSGIATANLAVSYLTPKINAKPKSEAAKEGAHNRDFNGCHGRQLRLLSEVILRKVRVPSL
jgi:hypothetical protein